MGNSNISKEPDNHSSGNGPSQSKFFMYLKFLNFFTIFLQNPQLNYLEKRILWSL